MKQPPPGAKKKGIHARWGHTNSATPKFANKSKVKKETEGEATRDETQTTPKLPVEILARIISFLVPHDDRHVLFECLTVSKTFFHLSAPILYKVIVVSGDTSHQANPLMPFPHGTKWYDPTILILDKAFRRDTLLDHVERLTISIRHRTIYDKLLVRLAATGSLKILCWDWRSPGTTPLSIASPYKDPQRCALIEPGFARTTVAEGLPIAFPVPQECMCSNVVKAGTRSTVGESYILKLRPGCDDSMGPLFRCHKDPSVAKIWDRDWKALLLSNFNSLHIVFWTSTPAERWMNHTISNDQQHPYYNEWVRRLCGGNIDSIISYLLTGHHIALTIVNSDAVLMPDDDFHKPRHSFQERFEARRSVIEARRSSEDIKCKPSKPVRFLTMDQYIEEDNWDEAFTWKEIEPWVKAKQRGAGGIEGVKVE